MTSRKPITSIPPLSGGDNKSPTARGLDFVFVSGDAYVDHPSFCTAIISRVLQSMGYSVGVIAQPDWHGIDDFKAFGAPKLAFLVSAGNIDSMVNHYTAAKRRRSEDVYSEGGRGDTRPDRATVVYSNRIRQAYPHVPIIIGGIEASLRRFAHYDYWDDKVRHSILYDSGADMLVYGMGENPIVEIAERLDEGKDIKELTHIRGTCIRTSDEDEVRDCIKLHSFTEVATNKRMYAEAFKQQAHEQDAVRGKRLCQAHEKGYLVANPPQQPMSSDELDAVYALPYSYKAHPQYHERIPALDEVEFSLTSVRGCYGGCNFCALTFHQGRVIQARSHDSIVNEAVKMTRREGFKGYIHDVGGPTANFRQPACPKQLKSGVCPDRQCIGYKPCPNLVVSHEDYVKLLRRLRSIKGVKKVFVRSGIRYDYVLYDKDDSFLEELCRYHVSGQLKIAPEHISERTLYYMNKPSHELYERFLEKYDEMNQRIGKQQYVVPYLMSSHPGCGLWESVELAVYLKKSGHKPQQVQDFYPTPGTVSTCMFYTGLDPRTMQEVYVPRTEEEKRMQRALMQYYLPSNFAAIRKALKACGREDLIGYGREHLVPPAKAQANRQNRR